MVVNMPAMTESVGRVEMSPTGENVGQYCIEHSVSLPNYFKEHKEYTEQNVPQQGITGNVASLTVDKMVSTLQAQLFVWLASDRKARKILEIGCSSGTHLTYCKLICPGYSSLAWAEGQKDLEDAEVFSTPLSHSR
jgi:hypothetical protein